MISVYVFFSKVLKGIGHFVNFVKNILIHKNFVTIVSSNLARRSSHFITNILKLMFIS